MEIKLFKIFASDNAYVIECPITDKEEILVSKNDYDLALGNYQEIRDHDEWLRDKLNEANARIAELEAQLEYQGLALGRSRLEDLGALEQFKINVLRLSKELKEARDILKEIMELGDVKVRHPANVMLCPYCKAEQYLKNNPE